MIEAEGRVGKATLNLASPGSLGETADGRSKEIRPIKVSNLPRAQDCHNPNRHLETCNHVEFLQVPSMTRSSDTPVSQRSKPVVARSTGIPAGPLESGRDSKTYRAAVIRPVPEGQGEGTLRLDPPGQPEPKLRHAKRFEEYISWLNRELGEIQHDDATASATPTRPPATDSTVESILDDSRYSPLTADRDAIGAFFSAVADTPRVQPDSTNSNSAEVAFVEPSPATSTMKPVRKFERTDGAHSVHKDTAAAHVSFPYVEQEQRDLEEALRARQTGRNQSRHQLEIELPLRSPADPSGPADAGAVAKKHEQELLRDAKTAELVSMISSVIASVLNESSETEMKRKAEDYLESVVQQPPTETGAEPSTPSGEVDNAGHDLGDLDDDMLNDIIRQRLETDQDGPTIRPGNDVKIVAEQPQETIKPHHAEQNTPPVAVAQPSPVVPGSAVKSVPLDLAAWDVEDFRWPVVTNQMIVAGGQAVGGLLSAVLQQIPGRPRRIAVSAVGRHLGTTSIAISVARWAVASGLRTLLIDADVASPALSGRVGMAANMSWLNGINTDLPVSELIIRSKKSNLCLMPLASSVSRVTWPRFIFDNLGELVEPVQHRFDLILVDAGPASQLLDELSSPQRLIDGVMLVNDIHDPKKLETFKTRLGTFGVERLIVADNRVPNTASNVA